MSDRWIECHRPKPNAKARLFTFPYAGGGAAIYRTWGDFFSRDIEVCALQLPGRENRISEKPFTELGPLVDALVAALRPKMMLPSAFFGHSMGAVLAFEVARRLHASGDPLPKQLFLSARAAPQLPSRHPQLHALPEPEFIEIMNQRYQAIPTAVINQPELLALLLPTLRADMAVVERYHFTPGAPLPIPLAVYGGKSDPVVDEAELASWQAQTSGHFTLQMFEGSHFFLTHSAHRVPLLQSIAKIMAALTA